MDNNLILSPKPERTRPQKVVCMHLTLISTCKIFLANSNQLHFLITMVQKGKFANNDVTIIFALSLIHKIG